MFPPTSGCSTFGDAGDGTGGSRRRADALQTARPGLSDVPAFTPQGIGVPWTSTLCGGSDTASMFLARRKGGFGVLVRVVVRVPGSFGGGAGSSFRCFTFAIMTKDGGCWPNKCRFKADNIHSSNCNLKQNLQIRART
jgi:hypothetical protein